jgi:hypothetical protein
LAALAAASHWRPADESSDSPAAVLPPSPLSSLALAPLPAPRQARWRPADESSDSPAAVLPPSPLSSPALAPLPAPWQARFRPAAIGAGEQQSATWRARARRRGSSPRASSGAAASSSWHLPQRSPHHHRRWQRHHRSLSPLRRQRPQRHQAAIGDHGRGSRRCRGTRRSQYLQPLAPVLGCLPNSRRSQYLTVDKSVKSAPVYRYSTTSHHVFL